MFIRYNWIGIAWAIFILVVCIIPVPDIPAPPKLNADKLFHAAVYAFLAFVLASGFYRQYRFPSLGRHAVKSAFLFAMFYGAFIELVQGALPYRSMDIFDLLANTAGALAGSLIYYFLFRPRKNADPYR
jgi:VanZ family protein